MATSNTLELQLVSELPTEWEKLPLILHDMSGATVDTLKIVNIVGITGEGIRYVLNNWNTYQKEEWITKLVISPYVRPPANSLIPDNYAMKMRAQVDAIAALYDALLKNRDKEGVPGFTASFEEKLIWGTENVEKLKNLTTEKVLGWISSGVNSQVQ